MPSETELDLSEEQKQKLEEKDITEDEVGECIESEMEEGIDQDQAVAICLSKLENGSAEPENTDSLDNPEFEVGDFVEWDFGGGESQGEIIDMTAEPGDSMSAGGNEFTVSEEDDEPLYKIEEWDETEGEDGEFTNNVVKFEGELSSADRPEAAERSAEPKTYSKEEMKDARRQNFRVKGGDTVVKENDDGDIVVNIPIQAMTEDRDGDLINEKGQESIIRQLKSGKVPLVPNHGVGESEAMYGFEDTFGQFVDGENRNGTTIGKARLLPDNEFSEKLIELLENDMPVGFSVGFIPTEKEPRDKEEGNGMEISDLDLMEVSAVGVPSNPDAVPQAMSSAVAMAKNAGLGKEKIKSTIEEAFEQQMDTMSESTEQDGESKTTENLKQITQEDLDAVLGAVGGALDAHMDAAIQEIESELESMVEETDEMDEDEDMEEEATDEDEEDEEMSQEPEKQEDASDHTEDSEKDESAESEKQEEGLSEDEKTLDEDNSKNKITDVSESENQEEKNESEIRDPRMMV